MNRKNIQERIREKIGEVAYTVGQIEGMLCQLGIFDYSDVTIRNFVKSRKLFVSRKEFGFTKYASKVEYWVPKSKLSEIIVGMKIAVTIDNLEQATYELGYQY